MIIVYNIEFCFVLKSSRNTPYVFILSSIYLVCVSLEMRALLIGMPNNDDSWTTDSFNYLRNMIVQSRMYLVIYCITEHECVPLSSCVFAEPWVVLRMIMDDLEWLYVYEYDFEDGNGKLWGYVLVHDERGYLMVMGNFGKWSQLITNDLRCGPEWLWRWFLVLDGHGWLLGWLKETLGVLLWVVMTDFESGYGRLWAWFWVVLKESLCLSERS